MSGFIVVVESVANDLHEVAFDPRGDLHSAHAIIDIEDALRVALRKVQ